MNDDLQLDVWSHNETFKPNMRVVMLGASNLSRAFPIAVSMSQQVFEGPLAIYTAKGHGRSYGQISSCFGKKISGIFFSGIWNALEREKSVPIVAFVTDIGNDLAYEVPVETVVGWVEACLDRLLALNARIVLSDLPIEALRHVSAAKYRLVRTILFPKCRLDLREMLQRAERLNEHVKELADSRKIPVFIGCGSWYRFDPIHPRRQYLHEMWTRIFSHVVETSNHFSESRCSLLKSLYLRALQPESWSFFSSTWTAQQPNGRLRDGTTISLY